MEENQTPLEQNPFTPSASPRKIFGCTEIHQRIFRYLDTWKD